MVRRVNRRIKRVKSGENGKKKAPVRSLSRQEKKKKNDVDTSYLVDLADNKMSSDDDLMAPIAEKTRVNKEKAPVKRRKFSRDPRLGAAERIRQYFGDIIKEWNTPGEFDSDPDEVSSDDSDTSPALEPGVDLEKEMAELKAYVGTLPSGEAWFKQFDEKLKDLEENEEEYLGERDHAVALEAVKFYNHKHSTNYVVEETLGSYCAEFDDGLGTHCNFRAQNTGGRAGRRPVSRLFFAELFGDVDGYKVDSCVTLDGPGRCRDIVRGCEMCPKQVRHPVNGFKVGHPDEYSV